MTDEVKPRYTEPQTMMRVVMDAFGEKYPGMTVIDAAADGLDYDEEGAMLNPRPVDSMLDVDAANALFLEVLESEPMPLTLETFSEMSVEEQMKLADAMQEVDRAVEERTPAAPRYLH